MIEQVLQSQAQQSNFSAFEVEFNTLVRKHFRIGKRLIYQSYNTFLACYRI